MFPIPLYKLTNKNPYESNGVKKNNMPNRH